MGKRRRQPVRHSRVSGNPESRQKPSAFARRNVPTLRASSVFLLACAAFLSGFLGGLTSGLTAFAGPAEDIAATRSNAIVNAIERAGPTVVNIRAVRIETTVDMGIYSFFDLFDPSFRRPRRQMKRNYRPVYGSGVIINGRDGYILTNEHVVSDAVDIEVTLQDGRAFSGAALVGADEISDLAVLKIDAKGLPEAILGDSDALKIGEWAIAIGNPFGGQLRDLKPTVTVGVVSADNRSVALNDRSYYNLIQTDASVNPGNSGGPLVNAGGEVIGINTFIFSGSGGSHGVNFAISINSAKKVIRSLIENGRVQAPWIGAHYSNLSPSDAEQVGLSSNNGAVLAYVQKDGPADKAGLKRGDLLVEINEQKIYSKNDAFVILRLLDPYEEARIAYERGGRARTARLTAEPPRADYQFFGVAVQDAASNNRSARGVRVGKVEKGSAFEDVLKKGDILRQALIWKRSGNGQLLQLSADLDSVDDLRGIEHQVSFGDRMRVRVIRGNDVETYDVRI